MCLYTKWVPNPKYRPNKKNKGIIPECKDIRTKYIPAACGNCIECRKAKQREWRIRLLEEIRHDKTGKFITLTFNEESLAELRKIAKTDEANAIATLAIRRFLERWRKKYKKSVKHWFITELGHKGTERVHLHGIIFTELEKEEIEERWQYGKIDVGYSMGERCINYIMKYVTKVDNDHKGFRGKILLSAGIGKGYEKTFNAKQNRYREGKTKETYKLNNGCETKLPIYYRNKIYTEEEKEKLWIEKLNKNEIYILGRKIKTTNEKEVKEALEYARRISKSMGYGAGEGKKLYLTKNNTKYLEREANENIFDQNMKLKIQKYENNRKNKTKTEEDNRSIKP